MIRLETTKRFSKHNMLILKKKDRIIYRNELKLNNAGYGKYIQ